MVLVIHEGAFASKKNLSIQEYITVDQTTYQLTYSDEYLEHLKDWEEFMTDVIDPLVDAGYLQWASIPEMGETYAQWEAQCGLTPNETPVTETFRIPSDSAGTTGIVVKMTLPGSARFDGEGAPVAIHIPGGTSGEGLNFLHTRLDSHGFIDISFNFPGSGRQNNISGGGL